MEGRGREAGEWGEGVAIWALKPKISRFPGSLIRSSTGRISSICLITHLWGGGVRVGTGEAFPGPQHGVRRGRGRRSVGIFLWFSRFIWDFVSLFQLRVLGCSEALGGALQRSETVWEDDIRRRRNFSLQPWASCHLSLGYGPWHKTDSPAMSNAV